MCHPKATSVKGYHAVGSTQTKSILTVGHITFWFMLRLA